MRKNVRKIIKRILSLLEEVESYEFHRQNLINSLESLFREYQEGRYTHAEYQKLLEDVLRRKTRKEWLDYYDSYILSIIKQTEPLLSQTIYCVYNDDSASRLRVVKEGFVEARPEKPRLPVIEEDKRHELKKIKEKKEEKAEFVEFERQPLVGRPPSPLKERFAQEIGEIRKGRKPVSIDVKIPEMKGKSPSFLSLIPLKLKHYFEKKKVRRKKRHIKKELEKIKKEPFSLKLLRLLERLKPGFEKKPEPVRLKKPSLLARLIGSAKSKLKPKKKLKLRKVPRPVAKAEKVRAERPAILQGIKRFFSYAKPAAKVHIPEARERKQRKAKPKAVFAPKKDKALERLASELDSINRSITDLKLKEPKMSLKMRLDLFIIRLHAALKHKKIVRKEKVLVEEAPEVAEEPEEIKIEVPEEVRAPVHVKKASVFENLRKACLENLQKIRSYLFVPAEKPKPMKAGEKAEKIPAGKGPSIIESMQKAFLEKVQRIFAPRPEPAAKPVPLKAGEKKAAGEPKPEEKLPEKPAVVFRFSWSSIKESYRKMMEREKRFVAKKGSFTPSLQMHALKEKVRVLAEEEKITPKLLKEEVESIQKIISERKKFKVYQPSFVGSFANATLRKFTFYLIERYPAFFKTLYDNLRLANIRVLSNTYVNVMLLTTMVVTALSSIFFFAFFLFTNNTFLIVLPKAVMMAVLAGGVTFLLFYTYPQMKAKSREASINTNLPFAINHISAVSGSGVPPTKMFKLIMESEEYGEIAADIEKVVEYVELFGYDLLTAVRSVAMITPSATFKEFLEGMVSAIESGGDLSVYLREKASEAMLSYELERQKYTETISTYSDIYTGILIAAPLFFIVALSLVSMLGGTIGGMDVNVVIVVGAYVIIPLLNIIFIIILELTQPEV